MGNLISTLKKNDSISFDLIKTADGEEHFKDEFLFIDTDNIEEYAKSDYFEGVNLSIYCGADIKNFDKLTADKSAWEFSLPIVKLHVQGVSSSQLENLLASVGAKVQELFVDFSDSKKLKTSTIFNNAPEVKKLTLKGESWDEDSHVELIYDDIQNINLDYLKIEVTGENKVIDLGTAIIRELDIDDFDAFKSILPSSLISLKAKVNGEGINWSNLKNLQSLDLSFASRCSIHDLSFLKDLPGLSKISLRLKSAVENYTIELPSQLEVLDLNTSGTEVNLKFIEDAPNLIALKLRTDVYNGGKGFKNADSISKLQQLEKLELGENGMGIDGYESAFHPACLNGLHSLKWLFLDGMMNIDDLHAFKGLGSLNHLKIRNSRIQSLAGADHCNSLKVIELYDCHAIDNLSHLTNPGLEKLVFSISSNWGTEVKLTNDHILQLTSVSIPKVDINIDGRKFNLKDFTSLSDKYSLVLERSSLILKAKE